MNKHISFQITQRNAACDDLAKYSERLHNIAQCLPRAVDLSGLSS